MSRKDSKRERDELKANRRVHTFFNSLENEGTFNKNDLKVLRESYDSLSKRVKSSDYSEVAMALTTVLFTYRNCEISAETLIAKASRDPLITAAIRDDNVLSLYGLNEDDLLIVSDVADGTANEENDEEDEETPKHLVKENSLGKK